MDEFKKANTLYGESRRRPRDTRHSPRALINPTVKICEHHDHKGCKASMEAYKLGLAKAVLLCNGEIDPPICPTREKLAAGKTIKELYDA